MNFSFMQLPRYLYLQLSGFFRFPFFRRFVLRRLSLPYLFAIIFHPRWSSFTSRTFSRIQDHANLEGKGSGLALQSTSTARRSPRSSTRPLSKGEGMKWYLNDESELQQKRKTTLTALFIFLLLSIACWTFYPSSEPPSFKSVNPQTSQPSMSKVSPSFHLSLELPAET